MDRTGSRRAGKAYPAGKASGNDSRVWFDHEGRVYVPVYRLPLTHRMFFGSLHILPYLRPWEKKLLDKSNDTCKILEKGKGTVMAKKISSKGLKTFSITLDSGKADFVKEWLDVNGISLSKYLNMSVRELYRSIKDAELVNTGTLNDGAEYLAAVARIMEVCRISDARERLEGLGE